MFNPWVLLGLLAAWVASIGAAGYTAYNAGQDKCVAEQARDEAVTHIASEAAASAAAGAISKLEVKHVTIRQHADTVIREVPVYRDCRHDPGVLRDINEARGVEPAAGGGVMPAASAPGR